MRGVQKLRWGWCGLALWLLVGCAGFQPQSLEQAGFLPYAVSLERADLEIRVAVPTPEEADRLFDSQLTRQGIQPIWISLHNRSAEKLWFRPHSVDPDYYPPLEVARLNHRSFSPELNRTIDQFYYDRAIGTSVPPGEQSSGFIFVRLDRGIKYVPIELFWVDRTELFEFFVPVPGLKVDSTSVDFEGLYMSDQQRELADLAALKEWVEGLPCCTSDAQGQPAGDPLNFVIVASDQAFTRAMKRARWDETEALAPGSAAKTAAAAVAGKRYRYAPISDLYMFGRAQDVGLQKARSSIHQRNHLRLWLAPVSFQGTPVWVGQISRDIGSKLTSKKWNLTTHVIDPDVDDARDALLLDLVAANSLARYAFVPGVGANSYREPRRNLTDDPYFTDGLRLLMFLAEERTAPGVVEFIPWTLPPD